MHAFIIILTIITIITILFIYINLIKIEPFSMPYRTPTPVKTGIELEKNVSFGSCINIRVDKSTKDKPFQDIFETVQFLSNKSVLTRYSQILPNVKDVISKYNKKNADKTPVFLALTTITNETNNSNTIEMYVLLPNFGKDGNIITDKNSLAANHRWIYRCLYSRQFKPFVIPDPPINRFNIGTTQHISKCYQNCPGEYNTFACGIKSVKRLPDDEISKETLNRQYAFYKFNNEKNSINTMYFGMEMYPGCEYQLVSDNMQYILFLDKSEGLQLWKNPNANKDTPLDTYGKQCFNYIDSLTNDQTTNPIYKPEQSQFVSKIAPAVTGSIYTKLIIDTDGSLKLYAKPPGSTTGTSDANIWSSIPPTGKTSAPYVLTLEDDGTFLIIDKDNVKTKSEMTSPTFTGIPITISNDTTNDTTNSQNQHNQTYGLLSMATSIDDVYSLTNSVFQQC